MSVSVTSGAALSGAICAALFAWIVASPCRSSFSSTLAKRSRRSQSSGFSSIAFLKRSTDPSLSPARTFSIACAYASDSPAPRRGSRGRDARRRIGLASAAASPGLIVYSSRISAKGRILNVVDGFAAESLASSEKKSVRLASRATILTETRNPAFRLDRDLPVRRLGARRASRRCRSSPSCRSPLCSRGRERPWSRPRSRRLAPASRPCRGPFRRAPTSAPATPNTADIARIARTERIRFMGLPRFVARHSWTGG